MRAIRKLGIGFGCWFVLSVLCVVSADQPARESAQQILEQSAKAGKYTFLVFQRDDGTATKALLKLVSDSLAKRTDEAIVTTVRISDPAAKPLVDKFDVSRAPMPLLIAVGPNGAMTGLWQTGVTEQDIAGAFVTPTMLKCMKSLQENKLVFVCVHSGGAKETPRGVKELMLDEHFKARSVLYSFPAEDAAEKKLLSQMQIDTKATKGTTVVFLAPPGVMIGKYDANTSMDVMATALHKAGKCCDDPNCKHNHAPQATQQPAKQKR